MKKATTAFAFGLILGLIGGVFSYRAWIGRFPTGNPFAKTELATGKNDPFVNNTEAPTGLPGGIPVYEKMMFRSKQFNNGKSEFVFSADGAGEDVYTFYQEHFTQAGWRKTNSPSPRWLKDFTICELDVRGSTTNSPSGTPIATITFRFSEVNQ
jgi:hypothetical protein